MLNQVPVECKAFATEPVTFTIAPTGEPCIVANRYEGIPNANSKPVEKAYLRTGMDVAGLLRFCLDMTEEEYFVLKSNKALNEMKQSKSRRRDGT